MKGVELEPLNQGDSLVSNIDRVDRQFDHLKYAAKTFQTVVKQPLVLNRHQRNALAPPIHRCPDEILVLIFEDLLISLKASYQLHELRLVCRRWYEVTESNPVLWSYLVITSKTRRRQIDTHLAKSRSAPLTIDLDLDGGDTLDIIFDQIPRWRALALHERSRPKPGRSFGRIPAAPSNLHLLAEKPAPLLRKLVLERSYRHGNHVILPTNLFKDSLLYLKNYIFHSSHCHETVQSYPV